MCPGGLRRFCLQNSSNQSIHHSCCTASASAVGWQLTWPCTSRVVGTSTYKSKPGLSSKDASGGTEERSISACQFLQNGVNISSAKEKQHLSYGKMEHLLTVTRICILLRLPMNLNSFESFCIKTLLKITEEMLFCIPCLHCWYYFSDLYLSR